jgi:hypothetical protein
MGITICPVTMVAAPVASVWELLAEPTLYDVWWDARTQRIVPEGNAAPGQVIYAHASGFGRKWPVTLRVERIDPVQHQLQLQVALPLGLVNHATITCTPIDATSCRLQFG